MKKACWRWVNRSAKKSVEAGASVRDIDQHLFSTSAYATCDFSLVKRGRSRLKSAPEKGNANFPCFHRFSISKRVESFASGKIPRRVYWILLFFPPSSFLSFFPFFLFLSTVATENVFRRKFKILFFFFDGFINFRSNDWKRSWSWLN